MKVSADFERKYTLSRPLGRGGMGVVYLALEPELGRHVAIKFLLDSGSADAESLSRFREEARVAAALKHPHVVPLYAAGEDMGNLFLVFEYVEGVTLQQLLSLQGPRPAAEAVQIMGQVLSGLAAAHDRGIIHRDLKPSNLMIRKDTGDAMIMDFGLAKAETGRTFQTRAGVLVGTPTYMSPEHIRGEKVDARSDLYALGCTFYHMLAGRTPYGEVPDHQMMQLQLKGPPPKALSLLDPTIPRSLDRLVARALEKDPGQRWSSALEMLNALEDLSHRDERASSKTVAMPSSKSLRVPQTPPSRPAPPPASSSVLRTVRMIKISRGSLAGLLGLFFLVGIGAAGMFVSLSSRMESFDAGSLARVLVKDASTLRLQLDVREITDAALHVPGAAAPIPGSFDGKTWTFLVPVAPGSMVLDAVVRGRRGFGSREYHLPPIKGLTWRLKGALEDYRPDSLLETLIKEKGFVRDTIFMEAPAPGAPDWPALTSERLSKEPFHEDLVSFRERSAQLFADPTLEEPVRRELYLGLMKLLPLDLFCLAQRQRAPLDIQQMVGSRQSVQYSLETTLEPEGSLVLIDDTTCFSPPGFENWSLMKEWHEKGGPPDMPAEGERRRPVQGDYLSMRSFRLERVLAGGRGGRFTLRAVVSYLDAKFYFEVIFRDEQGGEVLVVPLVHPGTLAWYRAMDGVPIDKESKPLENRDDPLGSTIQYMAMKNTWGKIEVELPRAWLPPVVPRIDVRYRFIPGGTLPQISDNQRLAYIKHLDLR